MSVLALLSLVVGLGKSSLVRPRVPSNGRPWPGASAGRSAWWRSRRSRRRGISGGPRPWRAPSGRRWGRCTLVAQLPRGVVAVHHGHLHVHQDHVERLAAGSCGQGGVDGKLAVLDQSSRRRRPSSAGSRSAADCPARPRPAGSGRAARSCLGLPRSLLAGDRAGPLGRSGSCESRPAAPGRSSR